MSSSSSSSSESQNPATPSVSFTVDDFTGAAHLSYPISVPPARAGLSPQISISYSSSGGNGWLGVGWDLAAGGYIQRRGPRKGVPKYDSTDVFELSLGGAPQELVSIGNNEYRLRIEGAYLKIVRYAGNYWQVWDKAGNKMTFGGSQSSRIGRIRDLGTFDFPYTYRWYLTTIQDPKTNYISFTYWRDQDSSKTYQVYLAQILYNGQTASGLSCNHEVIFSRGPEDPSDRSDIVYNYRGGFQMKTRKRLASIEVKTNGVRVRKYELGYAPLPPNARSVLESITLYGDDNPPPSPSLPPTTFTYQAHNPGFDAGSSWANPSFWWECWYEWICYPDPLQCWQEERCDVPRGSIHEDPFADILDINGDGVVERVVYDKSNPYDTWSVYHNNLLNGFTVKQDGNPWDWPNPMGMDYYDPETQGSTGNLIRYYHYLLGTYIDNIDMNGDGLPDRVGNCVPPTTWNVYFNNGNGFSARVSWPHPSGDGNLIRNADSYGSVYSDVIDMNGDGRPDRVVYGNPGWRVYLNTGSGFEDNYRAWPAPANYLSYWIRQSALVTNEITVRVADVVDMNGDGLPDRVVSDGANWFVFFNNGSGFDQEGVVWASSPFFIHSHFSDEDGDWANTTSKLIDMNGDGLPDLVAIGNSGFGPWTIYMNTGSGFSDGVVWPNSGDYNPMVDAFDINGDGLPDRVQGGGDTWTVNKNNGPVADLLSGVNNGIGGSIQISYTPSTKYANTHLPFIVQTVASYTQNDGRNHSYGTEYQYEGGYYNAATVEFRGFRKVTVCQPVCDGYESMTETWYHQDYLRKGKVETQILTSRPDQGFTVGHTRRVDNLWSWSDKVGIFLNNGTFLLDYDGDTLWDANKDRTLNFGIPGSPIVGDWNGSGSAKIGVYQAGLFYLDYNGNGVYDGDTIDRAVNLGVSGDPVAGDWNGDGIDTVGVYSGGVFYLRNSNTSGPADMIFAYGTPGDIPVAGDWNGDGIDTIGVHSNGAFHLRNSNSPGVADTMIGWGLATDTPVVGDWNGDGRTKIGVYRAGEWFLDYHGNGIGEWEWGGDKTFTFGAGGYPPVVGNWSGGGFTALLETTSTVTDMDQGVPYSYSHKTTYAYDSSLNVSEEHKWRLEGSQFVEDIRTYFEYTNDPNDPEHYPDCMNNWILSKPTKITVTDGSGNIASRKWMTYNCSTGNIEKEEVCKSDNPNAGCTASNPEQNPVIEYGYDTWNNLSSISHPRNDPPTTIIPPTTMTYDATKTHVYQTTNALGHVTTTEYDPGTGNLVKLVPPHLQGTTYWHKIEYDAFGRKTKEELKDDNNPTADLGYTAYAYMGFGDPDAQYVNKIEHIVVDGEPSRTLDHYTTTMFDGMGRTYEVQTSGPGNDITITETAFDFLGRVSCKTNPYLEGSYDVYCTYFIYDRLSRVTEVRLPDTPYRYIKTRYQGLKKIVTDQNNHSTAYTYDVYQRLVKVEEPTTPTTTFTEYSYDTLGNLIQVRAAKDASGNDLLGAPITTYIAYDSLSKKIWMDDPDMGEWDYEYDKSGNLVYQRDGKDQEITFSYDPLNRVLEKTFVNENINNPPTDPHKVVYVYDDPTVPYSKGKLTKVTDNLYKAVDQPELKEDKVVEYDVMQRVKRSQKRTQIDEQTFAELQVETVYDSAGRVITLKYFPGDLEREKVYKYEYDVAGNLLYLKDNATGAKFVEYSNFTALGQPRLAEFSNGVNTAYGYSPQTGRLSTLQT
jgi:YD repeat-containing protein